MVPSDILSSFLKFLFVFSGTDPKLQTYKMNKTETTVSGISSGGFFATQMQVALSSQIKGAGVIAAGHYNCGAEKYLGYCMGMTSLVSSGIPATKTWSGSRIDSVENLKNHKVFLISGKSDTVVTQGNVDQLYNYYKAFIPESNMSYKKDLPSGHTFPTDFDSAGNNACGASASPYISNCGYDGAGAILKQMYGDLNPRSEAPTGTLSTFDQTEFFEGGQPNGFANTGYVYVPKKCETKRCRLHVAFHGCKQNAESIGTKFVTGTGYDRWADTNKIIVLFPQTRVDNTIYSTPKQGLMTNGNACWDWVGWYGVDFQVRSGKQISTIKRMMDRILGA